MPFTYVSPASGDRDKVRTYIGDTDSTDPLLTDEQITFALSEGGTVKAASAIAAEWIAAVFSRKADKTVGDLSISYSQRAAQYRTLAAGLRSRSARAVLPYFGGISETAKDTRESDTDRVEPGFTVTMLDDASLSSASDTDSDADVS